MAKKARVWNPAVDNDVIKEKFQHDRTTTDAPVDFSRTANSSLPLLIQVREERISIAVLGLN